MVYNPYSPGTGTDPFKTNWATEVTKPTTTQPTSTPQTQEATKSSDVVMSRLGYQDVFKQQSVLYPKEKPMTPTYDIKPDISKFSTQSTVSYGTQKVTPPKPTYGSFEQTSLQTPKFDKPIVEAQATPEDVVRSADIALALSAKYGSGYTALLPGEIEKLPITSKVEVIPTMYTETGREKQSYGNIKIDTTFDVSKVRVDFTSPMEQGEFNEIVSQLKGLGYSVSGNFGDKFITGELKAPEGKAFNIGSTTIPLDRTIIQKTPKSYVGVNYPTYYEEEARKLYEQAPWYEKLKLHFATAVASSKGEEYIGTLASGMGSLGIISGYPGWSTGKTTSDVVVSKGAEILALGEKGVISTKPFPYNLVETFTTGKGLGYTVGEVVSSPGFQIATAVGGGYLLGGLKATGAGVSKIVLTSGGAKSLTIPVGTAMKYAGLAGLGYRGYQIGSELRYGSEKKALGMGITTLGGVVGGYLGYKAGYEAFKPKPTITVGYVGTMSTNIEGKTSRVPFVEDESGNLIYQGSPEERLNPNIASVSRGISETTFSNNQKMLSLSEIKSLASQGKILIQTEGGDIYKVGQVEAGAGRLTSFLGDWKKIGEGDIDFIVMKVKDVGQLSGIFSDVEKPYYSLEQLRAMYPHLNDEMLLKYQSDMISQGSSGLAGITKQGSPYIGVSTTLPTGEVENVISHEAWHHIIKEGPEQEAIIRSIEESLPLKPTYLEINPTKVITSNIDIAGYTSEEKKGVFASMFDIVTGGRKDIGASVAKRIGGEGDFIQRYIVLGATQKGGAFIDVHDVAQVKEIPKNILYGYGVGAISETAGIIGNVPTTTHVDYTSFVKGLSDATNVAIGYNIGEAFRPPTYIPIVAPSTSGYIGVSKPSPIRTPQISTLPFPEVKYKPTLYETPTIITEVGGLSSRPRTDILTGVGVDIMRKPIVETTPLVDIGVSQSLITEPKLGLSVAQAPRVALRQNLISTSITPSISIPFTPSYYGRRPKLEMGEGARIREEGKGITPAERKIAYYSTYPDLLSASVSQVRYGKATAPRFAGSEVEKYRRQFFTRVPTKEILMGGK